MPLISIARVFHFGHWLFLGVVAFVARWITLGVGRAKPRQPGEPASPGTTGNGGAYNPYRRF